MRSVAVPLRFLCTPIWVIEMCGRVPVRAPECRDDIPTLLRQNMRNYCRGVGVNCINVRVKSAFVGDMSGTHRANSEEDGLDY